ncbi:hypothetical protein LEP1GSC052_2465 [Leptospira kmetyi serovar Malaysia str. Bejo-Iso9]|nr:hypothetical protein LEP1GSC052_2465 [Leptospira kmetyi serovar Malaysia str. Bejo-Iso9]
MSSPESFREILNERPIEVRYKGLSSVFFQRLFICKRKRKRKITHIRFVCAFFVFDKGKFKKKEPFVFVLKKFGIRPWFESNSIVSKAT